MRPEKYVYIMRAGKDHYKVGITNSVTGRVRGIQTSNAMSVVLVTAMPSLEARRLEKMLHKWLHQFQASGGSEWFILTAEQAIKVVTKLTEYTIGGKDLPVPIVLAPTPPPPLPKPQPLPPVPKPPLIPRFMSGPDELFDEAVKVVFRAGRASASMLQRRLRVGYARAARLLDELEKDGVIGPSDGARARELIEDSPTLQRVMGFSSHGTENGQTDTQAQIGES